MAKTLEEIFGAPSQATTITEPTKKKTLEDIFGVGALAPAVIKPIKKVGAKKTLNEIFGIKEEEKPKEEKVGFFGGIAEDIRARGKKFGEIFEKPIGGAIIAGEGKQTLLETSFQATGQLAGAASDIIGRAIGATIKILTPKPVEEFAIEKGKEFLNTELGQRGIEMLQQGIEKFEEFEERNPRAGANIRATLNIAEFFPTERVAAAGVRVGKKVAKKTFKKGKKVISAIVQKNKTKAAKAVDDLFGKVVQGKLKDIPKAKIALQNIDIADIKTYKELGDILDTRIETIATKLDDVLIAKKGTTLLGRLPDAVTDAIDQLDDFYVKTKNINGKRNIDQIRKKANTQGLSVKEINDIARLHGKEISAFNLSGEAASGLPKQAAESTRKGVKESARDLLDNDAFALADIEMSDTIRTRELVKKMEEEVNKLTQKIKKRGLGERAGRLVFQIADKITGGGLSGFVQSFIPRGAGFKTLNALDLERGLKKNLLRLQNAIRPDLPEDAIISNLEDLLFILTNEKQLGLPEPSFIPVGAKKDPSGILREIRPGQEVLLREFKQLPSPGQTAQPPLITPAPTIFEKRPGVVRGRGQTKRKTKRK